jgi:hypothetical protein
LKRRGVPRGAGIRPIACRPVANVYTERIGAGKFFPRRGRRILFRLDFLLLAREMQVLLRRALGSLPSRKKEHAMLKTELHNFDAIGDPPPAFATDAEIEMAEQLRHRLEERYLALSSDHAHSPVSPGERH